MEKNKFPRGSEKSENSSPKTDKGSEKMVTNENVIW